MTNITNLKIIKNERKTSAIYTFCFFSITFIFVLLNIKYDVLGIIVLYGVLTILSSQKMIYWDTKTYFLELKK